MTINEFLGRFQHVKKTGTDKWQASCPCGQNHKNNDRKQSLSIAWDENTKKILCYCHTGCSIEDICEAVGCKPSDLSCNNSSQMSFIEWYGLP